MGRVGVEPLETPSEAALAKISNIEAKQSKAERDVFAQAAKEMQSLTRVVLWNLRSSFSWEPALLILFHSLRRNRKRNLLWPILELFRPRRTFLLSQIWWRTWSPGGQLQSRRAGARFWAC